MKKIALACLMIMIATAGAWGNVIPPQVTLSNSSTGSIVFTDHGSSISVAFNGTLSGNALLEPSGMLGKYWMWMVGGPITLTGSPYDYAVNMGTSVLYLEVKLGPGGNGSQGDLISTIALTDLFGAQSNTPQFDGGFNTTVATVNFRGLFPTTLAGQADFTVKLPGNTKLNPQRNGASLVGYVSSGEFVPAVPEPSSLAMLGTGVLGLAGLIRRKLK